MDKYVVDKKGRAEERVEGSRSKKQVKFPLCLAIKYGNDVPMQCPDFLLNTSRGKLFIRTDSPLPAGSKLTLQFYIPPRTKLLAELKGKVIEEGEIHNERGFFIKISDFLHLKLGRLEQYLEEERHLVDERA